MRTGDRITAGITGVGATGRHQARVYEELHEVVDPIGIFDVDTGRAHGISIENQAGDRILSIPVSPALSENDITMIVSNTNKGGA